jgi:hypothetical protein
MPIPAGPTSAPSWAPTLEEVADYTTARTLVPQPDGSNAEVFAFSSTTRPTADQVTRLISDAVGWITLKCGAIHDDLAGQANGIAAQRVAGFIELRYPERQSANREDAIATAKELLKLAEAARDELAAANEALTGEDPQDSGFLVVAPVWSFPAATTYGDLNL